MPTETNPKPVTSEGVDSSLDLGRVEPPTTDDINSLDAAMTAAGLGESAPIVDPAPPAADPDPDPQPIVDPPAADPDPQPPGDPAAPETPPAPPADPARSELEKIDLDAIEAPQDIHPKNLVNFNKLREVAKHYRTEAADVPALRQRVAELESGARLPEPVVKELEELRVFRRTFDTENDPEFKAQFDTQITKIDDDILGILKRNGLPEETEKEFRKLGLDKISSEYWQEQILSKLPFVDRERVSRRLADRADVADNRGRAIEEFTKNRETILQSREQEIFQHLNHLTANVPWARYREVPADAKPEQKLEIERHNESVRELESRFREALYPSSNKSRAEIAAAAVASIQLAKSVTDLSTRLKESNARAEKLEAELTALRTAGTPPTPRPSRRTEPAPAADSNKLSDEDAIESGLSAAESALS